MNLQHLKECFHSDMNQVCFHSDMNQICFHKDMNQIFQVMKYQAIKYCKYQQCDFIEPHFGYIVCEKYILFLEILSVKPQPSKKNARIDLHFSFCLTKNQGIRKIFVSLNVTMIWIWKSSFFEKFTICFLHYFI